MDSSWIDWKEEVVARYEKEKDRVVVANAMQYQGFTLRETFWHDQKYIALERKTLLNAAKARPLDALNFDGPAVTELLARCAFVKKLEPTFDFPTPDESFARSILPEIVKKAHNFQEMRQIDLASIMLKAIGEPGCSLLESYAPQKVKLENGRLCNVDYTNDPPIVRVRIHTLSIRGTSHSRVWKSTRSHAPLCSQ